MRQQDSSSRVLFIRPTCFLINVPCLHLLPSSPQCFLIHVCKNNSLLLENEPVPATYLHVGILTFYHVALLAVMHPSLHCIIIQGSHNG